MSFTRHNPSPAYSRGLHAFAVAFVVVTFALIILGGTVTSRGVGLSVPDWPRSLGHNMFLLPPSMWQGGVFYEHTHRLLGAAVGLISIAITVLLWVTQRARPWLRWFGVATLAMVIAQGVMGGLRVTEISEVWGVFHGITGQVFLCMTVVIAAATSRWWVADGSGVDRGVRVGVGPEEAKPQAGVGESRGNEALAANPTPASGVGLRRAAVVLLLVLFIQLALGASVRHSGSGLAIPDFPSAYGHVIPPFTQAGIDNALAQIPYDQVQGRGDVSPAQVAIHFAHRVWALAVVLAVLWVAARVGQDPRRDPALRRPAIAIVGLVILQVMLGATVIWSGRHPEIATAHQATGAVILATAVLLFLRIRRLDYARASAGEEPGCHAHVGVGMSGAPGLSHAHADVGMAPTAKLGMPYALRPSAEGARA